MICQAPFGLLLNQIRILHGAILLYEPTRKRFFKLLAIVILSTSMFVCPRVLYKTLIPVPKWTSQECWQNRQHRSVQLPTGVRSPSNRGLTESPGYNQNSENSEPKWPFRIKIMSISNQVKIMSNLHWNYLSLTGWVSIFGGYPKNSFSWFIS